MSLLDLLRSRDREPSRSTLAARGTVFLTALAMLVGGLVLLGRGTFTDRLDATVLVDTAGGALVPGSDVKYKGVLVGKVASLERADGDLGAASTVAVALRLTPSVAKEVPGDVHARILPASVFGTSFVDLVSRGGRTGAGAGSLRAGQRIPQDTSKQTLELQTVLDGLDRVVGALGPARLASTLQGLAGALDGNGERLGRSIVVLERYLSRLNPQMPLVRRNLELLATNLEAFARYAPDLFDATDNALVAARTLVDREADFKNLVRSGSRTFSKTSGVLSANEKGLVDVLVRSAVVVDALYDGRVQLVDGVVSVIGLADGFNLALKQGRYLQIDGNLQLQEDPGYGSADCPRFGSHRGRGC